MTGGITALLFALAIAFLATTTVVVAMFFVLGRMWQQMSRDMTASGRQRGLEDAVREKVKPWDLRL